MRLSGVPILVAAIFLGACGSQAPPPQNDPPRPPRVDPDPPPVAPDPPARPPVLALPPLPLELNPRNVQAATPEARALLEDYRRLAACARPTGDEWQFHAIPFAHAIIPGAPVVGLSLVTRLMPPEGCRPLLARRDGDAWRLITQTFSTSAVTQPAPTLTPVDLVVSECDETGACQPINAQIASAFLNRARPDALEAETRAFLLGLLALIGSNGIAEIVETRARVYGDMIRGARFVPFHVERAPYQVDARGSYLLGDHTWQFELVVNPSDIVLRHAPISTIQRRPGI